MNIPKAQTVFDRTAATYDAARARLIEIADAEYRMKADCCSSVEEQLAGMRDAGSTDAD